MDPIASWKNCVGFRVSGSTCIRTGLGICSLQSRATCRGLDLGVCICLLIHYTTLHAQARARRRFYANSRSMHLLILLLGFWFALEKVMCTLCNPMMFINPLKALNPKPYKPFEGFPFGATAAWGGDFETAPEFGALSATGSCSSCSSACCSCFLGQTGLGFRVT